MMGLLGRMKPGMGMGMPQPNRAALPAPQNMPQQAMPQGMGPASPSEMAQMNGMPQFDMGPMPANPMQPVDQNKLLSATAQAAPQFEAFDPSALIGLGQNMMAQSQPGFMDTPGLSMDRFNPYRRMR